MEPERDVVRHARAGDLAEVARIEHEEKRAALGGVEYDRKQHAGVLPGAVRRRHEHGLTWIRVRLVSGRRFSLLDVDLHDLIEKVSAALRAGVVYVAVRPSVAAGVVDPRQLQADRRQSLRLDRAAVERDAGSESRSSARRLMYASIWRPDGDPDELSHRYDAMVVDVPRAGVTDDAVRFSAFVRLWNVTGQPAITPPLPVTIDGFPVGVQLVGPPGRDDLVLGLAAQLEATAGR